VKAYEFADDKRALQRSNRAAAALRYAANFVERELAVDDPDLRWLHHVKGFPGGVALCEESLELLGRFGIGRGAWNNGTTPSESQIRNLLHRLDGAEGRERAAQRRDAV
jgi:hypothetical protein